MNPTENNGARANGAGPKPIDWFVYSLLQSTGQIQLIADHMVRFDEATNNHAESSIDETLQELISDTLDRLLDRDPEEYAAAAVLLADARKAIEEEVLLVEPGAFEDDCWRPEAA
ncbi:MAG TPA: hypothetical protein VHF58_07505 [Solirubrobacterales bacterium]|nr:hypothetical protein [Solirubrobacterales bacterium]